MSDRQDRGQDQHLNQNQSEEVGTRSQASPNADGAPASAEQAQAQAVDVPALVAERDEYLDRLQRSVAEFANYRRRTEQERAQVRELANRALLTQLLPVVDDFQRALAAIPEDQRDTSWVQGMALIERKLWNVLERAGVSPIEAQGQPFNPAEHEAIASEPGTANDTVVDVYQPGYRLGEGLLRPAMVKVGGTQGVQEAQDQTGQHGQHRKHAKSAAAADRWGREA